MGAFDPNRCDCDNDCPGFPICVCILIHDEHRCICDCWGGPTTLAADAGPTAIEIDRKFGWDTIVDLVVREATLGEVAAKLAAISADEILAPAHDLDKPVALSLRGLTLDAAIREAGLVLRDAREQTSPADYADS
jgi:hypothetical protein